jgi:nucleoside-diphosphate-sugar epimerase
MKRVLVTGATGFIGRYTIPALLERGFEVHTAARATPAPSAALAVHAHMVNLLDEAASRQLITTIRPSHLLHLAWTTKPGTYWTDLANLDWLSASISLVKSFINEGGERIVGAGSVAEYDLRYGHCSESHTPLNPQSLYGSTKNALRAVLDSLRLQEGLSTAWGRLFFLYGPGEADGRLISSISRSLLRGEPAHCTLGRQVRDYLFVEDAAQALSSLLDSDVTGAINIASGLPVSVRELAIRLGDEIGLPDLLQFGAVDERPNEPPYLVADVDRLRHDLKWLPQYSLPSGITRTVDWWRNEIAAGRIVVELDRTALKAEKLR